MPSYVVFLRAINLGAKRKVAMADLRECLTEAGYEDVETYIQTGNVRVRTTMRSAGKVADRIEDLLEQRFDFEIPAMVFTPAELAQVYDDALAMKPPPYAVDDHTGRYVILYKRAPTADQAAQVAAWESDHELGLVSGRALHQWIDGGLMDSVMGKKLWDVFIPGTSRTLKVIRTCVERWC